MSALAGTTSTFCLVIIIRIVLPTGFGQQNMKPIYQIYYTGQEKIGSHAVKSAIRQKIPQLDNRCNNISPSVTNHLELAYLAEKS